MWPPHVYTLDQRPAHLGVVSYHLQARLHPILLKHTAPVHKLTFI